MSEITVAEGSQNGDGYGSNTHNRDKRISYNSDVNTDTGRMDSKPQNDLTDQGKATIDPNGRLKYRDSDSNCPDQDHVRLSIEILTLIASIRTM